MKRLFFALVGISILASCAVKVPLTKEIKDEYNLTKENMDKVQYFVSSEIILERSHKVGSSTTNSDGTLVTSSSNVSDRIIILPRTKCVLEKVGDKGEVLIRFETGPGKSITFATRPNMDAGKYYFVADWQQGKGGRITYGEKEEYFATASSGNAYLLVKVKKSARNKRKDRVVKGMKV
ncbi:MAG: hypothetical protein ACSHXL_07445 [Bacteroidota bacterium]